MVLLRAAMAAALAAPAYAQLYKEVIQIADGKVQGFQALNNTTPSNLLNYKDITVWKGIPYAADTGGQNRWKPPQKVTPWNDTFQANAFGYQCPDGESTDVNEDCLTVNIWSPATSADEKLPVAVWNYGAGGTSSGDQWDGSGVADKGIVFVNFNYRVSAFGFLALPELNAESPHNVSGNYGLLDQIEVIRWIKNNIAAFGGDPEHITVLGQSFGSGTPLHVINSPLAKDLGVVGAIAESGIKSPWDPEYANYGSVHTTYDVLIPYSETYVADLNVSTLAELRALTTAELDAPAAASAFTAPWYAVVDGWAVPTTYLQSLLDGPVNDVPVLVGNNRDEDGVNLTAVYTVAEYYTEIEARYGDAFAAEFAKLYEPGDNSSSATLAYFNQIRDQSRISTWEWASLYEKKSQNIVYTYEWNHAPPAQDQGAFHASEIPYVLNTLYADTSSPWEAIDYHIADIVSSYWANFIKTGNPNEGGAYKEYYGLSNLTYWGPSYKEGMDTFNIGDYYAVDPLALEDKQVELALAWFHNTTTTPY